MNCLVCGSTDLDWTPDGAHARCRRCPSLFTRSDGGLRQVVVEAPGGGYNPDFQAIFESNLGFGPRAGMPSYGGPGYGAPGYGGPSGAPPGNPMQRTIQLMVFAFIGFIFLSVGVYVAIVLFQSLPH